MVEILVATSIIAASVLGAMAVAQKSIYVSRQAFRSSQAAFLLEEGAEAIRILRDNSWSNVSGLSTSADYYPTFLGGTWTLSTAPSQMRIFTRKVNIENVLRDSNGNIATAGSSDAGTKLITINVSWQESGQTISQSLSFYLSDIFS